MSKGVGSLLTITRSAEAPKKLISEATGCTCNEDPKTISNSVFRTHSLALSKSFMLSDCPKDIVATFTKPPHFKQFGNSSLFSTAA